MPSERAFRLTPSVALRSILFTLWTWGLGLVMGIACLPLLLGPRKAALAAVRTWARLVLWALERLVGCAVEIRGLERLPEGGVLIAAKHQGMLDIIPPLKFLGDPSLVMKKELLRVPIFGWFSRKIGMIVVDREAAAKALRAMVEDAEAALSNRRQILIFPEGTRKEPGAPPDYKPGIAGLYRELAVPCFPLATNSGLFWPARGLWRFPGRAVFEILPPIEAGLKRAQFMKLLEERIEGATERLLEEGARGSKGA